MAPSATASVHHHRDSQGASDAKTLRVWISIPSRGDVSPGPTTHVARQLPLARLVAGAKMDAAKNGSTGSATTTPQTAAEARAAAKMNGAGTRGGAAASASPAATAGAVGFQVVQGAGAAGSQIAAVVPTTVTDLGRQVIEGVTADGSRSTSVIAVGAIGNDRPIDVVSERWLSPELQVLVVSRLHDPRNGDTTFHLTDIRRSEPDRSLFVVPAGYRIELGK